MSKIKSLTIVIQQGTSSYHIGDTLNGMVLDRIEDTSIEYPDGIQFCYSGRTQDGELVFEAINCPVEIVYEA